MKKDDERDNTPMPADFTGAGELMLDGSDAVNSRRAEIAIILILFAFGVYESILYFGHLVVPNPDFTAFVNVGRQFLAFEIPSSFKRAPVLGILQILLSHLIGGDHPELTAGWLLNAILHPFNIVLIYLVGRYFIGRFSAIVAIITAVNPWIIYYLQEPIAETTLLFCVLLSFYLMMRRSPWCYLAASVASMVRYEGAALIFVAFILDLIYCTNRKEKILRFVYAAAASVPLMLWMLGTILSFRGQGQTHYLKELGASGSFSESFISYLDKIWYSNFNPLAGPGLAWSQKSSDVISVISKCTAAAGFLLGVIGAFARKNFKALALLIFLVLYLCVHSLHSFVLPRFCTTINWMVLMFFILGLEYFWYLLNKNRRIPRVAVIILQAVLLAVVIISFGKIISLRDKVAQLSRRSFWLPYAATVIVIILFLCRRLIYQFRQFGHDLCVAAVVCFMIFSNQLYLVHVVGSGDNNIEFKMLADWCRDNTEPGEKIVSTMSNVVAIFIPQRSDDLINISAIDANSPYEFVQKCYLQNITYVTWDSRIGQFPGSRYYELWKIDNIAFLSKPKSVGHYEFVTQIKADEKNYINVFRLIHLDQKPAVY